jgi:hypothetical protein
MIGNKRGRPKKYHPTVPMGIADAPYPSPIDAIKTAIMPLPCVAALSPNSQQTLIDSLIGVVGHYPGTKNLRAVMPSKAQGNRENIHTQVLLADCRRAWARATQENAAIWEVHKSELYGAQESPPVAIAKALIKVITGKPARTLRRQIARAKEITYP